MGARQAAEGREVAWTSSATPAVFNEANESRYFLVQPDCADHDAHRATLTALVMGAGHAGGAVRRTRPGR
jgi:hypothetical protein